MIRFLITYDTPADPDAFDRHYRKIHEPLTRQIPGVLSYTVVRAPHPVRGPGFYQVVELSWTNWDAARNAFRSPEGRAAANDLANLDAPVRSCVYEVPDIAHSDRDQSRKRTDPGGNRVCCTDR